MMHDQALSLAERYIRFQTASSDPFHVVKSLLSWFDEYGFESTDLSSYKPYKPGDRLLIPHPDGKGLLVVIVGKKNPCTTGFNIIGAHTDSPCLRLRLNPWSGDKNLIQLETQLHGSLIARSWLDRPLKISGAVWKICRNESGKILFDAQSSLPAVEKTLVNSKSSLAIIPDLAIHLDPAKNTSGEINKETMLSAFVGNGLERNEALRQFWQELNISIGAVDGFELSLSPSQGHQFTGIGQSYLTGPRHDDLAMVFCASEALCRQKPEAIPDKTAVCAFFDAEETGSVTCSGAGSAFIRDMLLRLALKHQSEPETDQLTSSLSRSFLISADMAHGYHPAHAQKYDKNHQLMVNGGLVLKENANDRYATSGAGGAIFQGICEAAGVPLQGFINRQDMGCGSTIGPILSASLNCMAVDVGTAMWAMHSTGETMGTHDLHHASEAFRVFFKGGAGA